MTHAGEFNQLITFQTKSATRDAFGGEVITWTDGEQVWAKIAPATGEIVQSADQPHAATKLVVTIRYLSTVTAERRFLWDGVQHEIDSVIRVEGRTAEMEILARAGLKE